VQIAWLAIIGVSLVPVGVAAFYANPLVMLTLGPAAWRERVARLHPYRWWVVFAIAVCAFATAVYSIRWG
jgi:hypothetical protein